MFVINVFFILIFKSFFALSHKQNEACLDEDYKFMSTKTDYNLIGNKKNFNDYSIPKCKQIGIWHLLRHGARYPDYEDIVLMNEFLVDLRDTILKSNNSWLCTKDLELLKSWKPRIKPEDDNFLTTYGNETIKQLGIRNWARHKELIFNTILSKQFKIQTTDIPRTIQSAEKYLEGLLYFWPIKPKIEKLPALEDNLLKYPDLCDKFIIEVDTNSTACSEAKIFDIYSFKYREARSRLMRIRMGLPIEFGDTASAFDYSLKMCQYEYLMDKTNSIWCKFFDQDLLKLLEYREDIKYHCKYGFKHDISRLMSCDLVKNLLESLKTYKKGFEESDQKAKKIQIFFSHSSTILTFLASIGIGKSANNFNYSSIVTENINRQYKITNINPMNSNIEFVLYNCQSESKKPKYNLRAFHNENLVQVDGCSSVDCDLEEFYNYNSFFINSCISTKEACKNNN